MPYDALVDADVVRALDSAQAPAIAWALRIVRDRASRPLFDAVIDRTPELLAPWRVLVQEVFERDPLRCPGCGGVLVHHATILEADRAWEVLRWVDAQRARDGPIAA